MEGGQVLELPVLGRFDLAQSIGFGFGGRTAASGDAMRMAFVLDGYREKVAVSIQQPAPDRLAVRVWGEADPDRVASHAARVLSVDVDATGYDCLVDADPVLAQVYRKRPGLRPPLFYSAYEALVWSVLSARRPVGAMRAVRDQLSARHGRLFQVDGREVAAFPTPSQLARVTEFPGIPQTKLDRMRTIAEAALDGELDTEALRAADPSAVAADLSRGSGRSMPSWSPFGPSAIRTSSPSPRARASRRPAGCWAANPSPSTTSPSSRKVGVPGGPGPPSPSAPPAD